MLDSKCKWEPEENEFEDYSCQEKPLPGDLDSYCIIHSKNGEKDLDAFSLKIKERLDAHEKVDLTGCHFPTHFDSKYFKGFIFDKPISFNETSFSREIDFCQAKFSASASFFKASFMQNANFDRTTFSDAYFIGTVFSQNVRFCWAQFTKADFAYSVFSGDASFGNATFSQEADFREATFSSVDFLGTSFVHLAIFTEAVFSQAACFIGSKFSEAYFDGISFEEGVSFSNAEFNERVLFEPSSTKAFEGFMKESNTITKTVFGPSYYFYTRFLGETIFQDVDLSQCAFLHSKIDHVDFRYCKFGNKDEKLLGFIHNRRQNVLKDEIDADADVGTALAAVRERTGINPVPTERALREEKYEPVRRLYLELKKNFEEKRDWNTAGDFHYGEMECIRKVKGWLSLEGVYCLASGYGERPWRAFTWLLAIVLIIFPFLYLLSEGDPFGTCVWDSVKVATFMKIGSPVEPDTVPGKFFLALEFIISPIFIALLALALRRKVKR